MSIVCFCWLGSIPSYSQEDSTAYIHGLPVSEDDMAQLFVSEREQQRQLTPVSADALPKKVLKALRKGRQYEGWQDSLVYFDRNTRLFVVPVKTTDGVKVFGLNEDGNPVTFDEVSPSPE